MPNLIIIAGCNGAGKSTFAPSFLQDGLFSFDYDRLFIENYNSLPDSEFREEIARNQTIECFEKSVEKALSRNEDFCYETNFDANPLHYRFFDNILLVDNSKQNDVYTNLLQIEKGEIVMMTEKLPDYFQHRLPDIYKLVKVE